MLKLTITGEEAFDELKNEFVRSTDDITVELEHSLVSLSKWESEFEIAFLGRAEKTNAHITRYVEHMSLTPLSDPTILRKLSSEQVAQIREYITSENSATRLAPMPGKQTSRETVTSELIYYWMIALNIPWEAQYWHLNRLMTLIDLTQRKNNPPKNTNSAEARAQRAKLNRARRGGRPG